MLWVGSKFGENDRIVGRVKAWNKMGEGLRPLESKTAAFAIGIPTKTTGLKVSKKTS